MPKKYHVKIKTASPRYQPVGKYATLEFREDCAGACIRCVKKRCVYLVFQEENKHINKLKSLEYHYGCNSCFRCVQECTKGIFSRVVNPEYLEMGDDYWQPDIIQRTWYQANTGKIPVSGAGYRGPFVGEGFDSMWTDMSEIVRPTRDGIHGREYINTSIEVSRKAGRLSFDENRDLPQDLPPIMEIQIPLMFQQPDFGLSENMLLASVMAVKELGTMMFIKPEDYSEKLYGYSDLLIPMLSADNYGDNKGLIEKSRMVELSYSSGIEKEFEKLRSIKPGLYISIGIPLDSNAAEIALTLADTGVDTLHFYANMRGRELNSDDPRHLKDMIREIHSKLVDGLKRKKICMIFSGGIAMAEHMAKSIICGADGVTVDLPLLIALECRLCGRCTDNKSCPVDIENFITEWGKQRIVNLIAAWRNQLIEVMGAMGIREVRRLRGEIGRSMSFEDLERESFGPIFGERKVSGLG